MYMYTYMYLSTNGYVHLGDSVTQSVGVLTHCMYTYEIIRLNYIPLLWWKYGQQ